MSYEAQKYQTQEDLPCPVNQPVEFAEYLDMRQQEARAGKLVTNKVAYLEDSPKFDRLASFRMLAVMAG